MSFNSASLNWKRCARTDRLARKAGSSASGVFRLAPPSEWQRLQWVSNKALPRAISCPATGKAKPAQNPASSSIDVFMVPPFPCLLVLSIFSLACRARRVARPDPRACASDSRAGTIRPSPRSAQRSPTPCR